MDPKKTEIELVERVEGGGQHVDIEKNISGPVDKALQVLKESHDQRPITAEDSNKVLRKIDLRILPFMLVAYTMQQLDKSALSFASLFGIQTDANLVGNEFSNVGSAVFWLQLAAQPFVAYCLVRFPPAKYLGVNLFFYGLCCACTAAAKSYSGILACRMLLGFFEASIAPTFVAIIQLWYRRREQSLRNAYWYSANGVAGMFGSLLSFGLGHINGSLKSYQIIFLFIGTITFSYSFIVILFLPDSPLSAKFLDDHEKLVEIERVRHNQMGIETKVWKWNQVWETLTDIKSYIWFLLLFSASVVSGGLSTFGPLILQEFGFNGFQTALLNIPSGAAQIISVILSGYLATKFKLKSPVLVILSLISLVGAIMIRAIPRTNNNKGPLLLAFYLIQFSSGITPMMYSFAAQNTAGETKKKCVNAMLFLGQNSGNIVGPLLYIAAQKPLYTTGLTANMSMFAAIIVLIGLAVLYMIYMKKKHRDMRIAVGKPADVTDLSMALHSVMADNADFGAEETVDNGLLDMTDLKNEDFIYVL